MTSVCERRRRTARGRTRAAAVLVLGASSLAACGLTRPEPPPPFDCAAIDRAEERFPDVCGDPAPPDEDAGLEAENEDGGGGS